MRYLKPYNKILESNQFLTNKDDIVEWLQSTIGLLKFRFTISNDFVVNVENGVEIDLANRNLDFIPVKFGKTGSFYCYNNNLTSLKGCPDVINGNFSCRKNNLLYLDFIPDVRHGGFYYDENPIHNLIATLLNKSSTNLYNLGFSTTRKVIEYLNDYDVVKGNKIYLDNLKEVLYIYDIDCNIDNLYKLDDYIIV